MSLRPANLRPARRARRGSVLVVALLLMVGLALGLTSFLQLNLGSARLAARTHQQAAAFHLAEAGAEEALWSFNRAAHQQPGAWDGWTREEPAARRRFTGFDLGGNTRGEVQVHVNSTVLTAARPTILALASVQAPGERPVTRMLEVTLGRRTRFAAGLLALERIAFAGTNVTVDSWDSDPDRDPATPPVPYTPAVRNDRGSIASASVQSAAVLLNRANIWGRVATGGGAPQIGTGGSITGRDTPAGVAIDPARITTDFVANLPALTAPVDGTLLAELGDTVGTPGTATRWRCPALNLNGRRTLTVLGDVTLIFTAGPGTNAINVMGSAEVIIPEGSSLTVYVEGDIHVGGQGLTNRNPRPLSCQVYGVSTSPAGQTIRLAGNGSLTAVVYAPNGDVTLNGNGDMMGAVVARNITLTGNAAFHYDESLADFGADMPYGVVRWRELDQADDRAARARTFTGW